MIVLHCGRNETLEVTREQLLALRAFDLIYYDKGEGEFWTYTGSRIHKSTVENVLQLMGF